MRLIVFLLCILCSSLNAQELSSKRASSVEIFQKLEKLNFLGSALYIAAHPDDENTRLIAYMSNELNANTAYLSMTRGDGGQNLIGTEIKEELGVLRTHELLQARSIDGGSQFFTRAIDFGYSKHPDETFQIWNEEEVMSDIVWVIRNFKPDIIVNRFDHRTPGKTHGHHTGSAMLSLDAFDQASDPNSYPDQLDRVDTWNTERLFFNTSWWFYGSRDKFAEADKSNLLSVDIGEYKPMLGSSISEIAIRARSKHLSQGFGSTPTRGSRDEWLEYIKGSKPNSKVDMFEGINTSWSRVKGGDKIGQLVDGIIESYDFKNPSNSLKELVKVHDLILSLDDDHWQVIKLKEVKEIIADVSGLYLEAISDQHMVSHGDSIELNIEATNRSHAVIQLKSMEVLPFQNQINGDRLLEYNTENRWYHNVVIESDLPYSAPYWLEQSHSVGMYSVDDENLIGKAISADKMMVRFNLEIDGSLVVIDQAVIHKYSDPAKGEVYKPFEVTQPVFMALDKEVYLFADKENQHINVEIQAGKNDIRGYTKLALPQGWKSIPDKHEFEIHRKGSLRSFDFEIIPIDDQYYGELSVVTYIEGKEYSSTLKEINYEHVPVLTMTKPAKSKLVRIPLVKSVDKIAYIMGAGDKMPESLRNVGYDLDVLELKDIDRTKLSEYDAVILGIRIYNVNEEIGLYQDLLFDYVKEGGTLIAQYNTSRRLKVEEIAPYPLKLSRDRVTDEKAPITILNPEHRVLNYPNKITEVDFQDWEQERGLYFPNEWAPEFETIISTQDKGEEPKEGSLLIAKHGQGHYVYTGLSWFRELPAGVPGAYRLFANIVALGTKGEQ